MSGLLVGNDEAIASWTYRKFNVHPQSVDKALGIVDKDGKLVGGILFQNFNGCDLHLSYYGIGTVSAGICRIIARTALEFFNCGRLTVITRQKNKRLILALMKMGFRFEGVMKRFYGHDDNKR